MRSRVGGLARLGAPRSGGWRAVSAGRGVAPRTPQGNAAEPEAAEGFWTRLTLRLNLRDEERGRLMILDAAGEGLGRLPEKMA